MFDLKKLVLMFVTSLFVFGLSACDMFNTDDIEDIIGEAPYIVLNGEDTVTIGVGSVYEDAGATAFDVEDGDLTAELVIVDNVNEATPGTYTVTFDVTDSDGNEAATVTRTVIVVAAGDNDPVISLVGNATITINAGDAFVDQGATATDIEDEDLSDDIVVTGSVNKDVPGEYTLTYTVTDSDGNSSSVTRTVIVLPSSAEVLANMIVDNWDGSLQFLGLMMAGMDFSEAMTMTFELEFEVTEDIDEIHYFDAVVTDRYLYAATGDIMHRTIDLDIDGEMQLSLGMIYEEVDTGVHLYIEYRPILDFIAQFDSVTVDTMGYAGLDDQWALFQIDDSLQNIVEVEVVKDMLVSLFFQQMGDSFFDDAQLELEGAIGFDLNQYGVDFDAFIDLLIAEDIAAAQLMLEGIQLDAIVLHLDHMLVAWQLHALLQSHATELANAGFDVTKLALLDTATENPTTMEMEVNEPIDPTKGTVVFFQSLTQVELDLLVDIVIKPIIEMMVTEQFALDVDPIAMNLDFEAMLNEYGSYLATNWPYESGPFVLADELAELQTLGAYEYWKTLTYTERETIWWAIDYHFTGYEYYRYELIDTLDELIWQEADLMDFLTMHQTALDAIGFNTAAKIAALETEGIIVFLGDTLTPADIELVMDAYVYPIIEGLIQAVQTDEVPEYLITTILNDPHVVAALGMMAPTDGMDPYDFLDIDNLTANLTAVDFDQLALEVVDMELLFQAIYQGPVAYDAYLLTLETSAPNAALILSLFAPAIAEAQPYMVIVDDFTYAIDGLSIFDHYLDPAYWLTDTEMDLDLAVTEEFYVQTEMHMTPAMYQILLQDILDDVYGYLSGFQMLPLPWDENWVCIDPMDETCETLPIADMLAQLNQMGDMGILLTFDPTDPSWMNMELDATAFLDVVVQQSNAWMLEDPYYVADPNNDILTGVNAAIIRVTMEEGGTIVMPDETDVDDLNDLAQDFGKFAVVMTARDYIRELYWHYEYNTSELLDLMASGNTTFALDEFYFLDVSMAFDPALSTIAMTVVDADPFNPMVSFELTLYWIDGTTALNGTLDMSDFEMVFDIDNNLIDAAAYQTMLSYVDDTNYNMTKLFLLFVLQE